MKCPSCGIGDIAPKEVQYKQNGRWKEFTAYSCNRYPECKAKMKEADYFAALKGGEIKLADKKSWASPNHKPYRPKQRTSAAPNRRIPVRQLTIEQELALVNVKRRRIIRINADAGTGKSTLAKQVAARLPAAYGYLTTGVILAFAKRNALELADELPGNWISSTVHALGSQALVAAYGVDSRAVNKNKTEQIIYEEYKLEADEDDGLSVSFVAQVSKMVSLCKAMVFDETISDESIIEWSEYYSLTLPEDIGRACTMVRNVLKISRSKEGIVRYGHDYDDMPWIPVINKLPVAQYPIVIVDEAQDLSRARIQLALMACIDTFFFVGDTGQAIFGFTFADTQSMDNIAEAAIDRFSSWEFVEYAITVNFRCPSLVLDIVRHIHPSIKTRPNAPRGFARRILHEHTTELMRPGDLVLCRTNAPLVEMAYMLLKAGIAAVVLGRDVAERLEKLIMRYGRKNGSFLTTMQLISNLNDWYNESIDKIDGQNSRNKEKKKQELFDDYECIVALCGIVREEEDYNTDDMIPGVAGVINKIKEMFGETSDQKYDPKKVITLSTVHKMKGGQSARVFLLHAKDMHPHPMASGEWEQLQELNILYVALTRCGDGTDNPDQGLYFVGVTMDATIPEWLADVSHLIEPYDPYQSLTVN